MKNFLFIIQRYGLDVDGGAELYCRWLAEKVAGYSRVTVLTTTARDYVTWENHYSEGAATVNGIPVIRQPVLETRDIRTFNQMTGAILQGDPSIETQYEWLRRQGPWSPGIQEYLRSHHGDYDGLIFFTYLYATTVLGTQIAPARSILIPTAHDEPVAHLTIMHEMYERVAGLMYLTPAEQTFVEKTYDIRKTPAVLIGTGVDLPDGNLSEAAVRSKYGLHGDVLLYIGRVEAGKGCAELVNCFKAYQHRYGGDQTLVLAGRRHMDVPDDPAIVCPGYIPDEDIVPLINAATAVIVPSPFESLSILLLQSFQCGVPVVANGHAPVLAGHCRASNGGLYYETCEEFIEVLHLLLSQPDFRRKLGQNGYAYVQRNYTWHAVLEKFQNFTDTLFK